MRGNKREQGRTRRTDKEIFIDSLSACKHWLSSLWEREEKVWRGGAWGGGGDDTSRTDRKTGGRRWEMERKGERKESKKELQCLVLI